MSTGHRMSEFGHSNWRLGSANDGGPTAVAAERTPAGPLSLDRLVLSLSADPAIDDDGDLVIEIEIDVDTGDLDRDRIDCDAA